MKTARKLITLFSLAGLSGAAAAEAAGLPVATVLNAEAGISLFATVFALLVFGADYARPTALERKVRRPVLLPAAGAFRAPQATRPSRAVVRAMQRNAELVTTA